MSPKKGKSRKRSGTSSDEQDRSSIATVALTVPQDPEGGITFFYGIDDGTSHYAMKNGDIVLKMDMRDGSAVKFEVWLEREGREEYCLLRSKNDFVHQSDPLCIVDENITESDF